MGQTKSHVSWVRLVCLRRGSLISLTLDGGMVEAEEIGIVTVVPVRQALSLAEPAIDSLSADEPMCRLMLILPDHATTSLHV
jgi:hypothetical protein